MPLAAHIAQTGSVTSLLYPPTLNWFYPQSLELIHAGGILLYGNDFLSPLLNMAGSGRPVRGGASDGRTAPARPHSPPSSRRRRTCCSLAPAGTRTTTSSRSRSSSPRWPSRPLVYRWPAAERKCNLAGRAAAGRHDGRGPRRGASLGTKLTVVPPILPTLGVIVIAGTGHRWRAATTIPPIQVAAARQR